MPGMSEQLQTLARYSAWMNRRLYALCAALPDEERRRDRGAFFGSIHRTLNHLLLADSVWMTRFSGDRERYGARDAAGALIPIRSLDQELYGDWDELARNRAAADEAIQAFMDGVTDELLAAPLRYQGFTGKEFVEPRWWAMTHFFNHGTHHRGQVTTLLSQAGVDPGVTDLIAFVRDPATR
jgi:uncharacterized damage-inducible protein DinB